MFNSLQSPRLQHIRLSCPSPSPGICSNSCLLSWWYYLNCLILCCPILLLPSVFPSIRDFPNELVIWSDDQNTGASASASVLPMSIQGWFLLRLTGLISVLSKRLSGVYSSTSVWRHQFRGTLPSGWRGMEVALNKCWWWNSCLEHWVSATFSSWYWFRNTGCLMMGLWWASKIQYFSTFYSFNTGGYGLGQTYLHALRYTPWNRYSSRSFFFLRLWTLPIAIFQKVLSPSSTRLFCKPYN